MDKIIKTVYSSKDGGAMCKTLSKVGEHNVYLSIGAKSYLVDKCITDVLKRFLNGETEYVSIELQYQ